MPKYDLAISFAGEQRKLAESLARRLDASGYAVFYDEFEQAHLWGGDLSVVLGDVYEKQARHCLVIVSAEYVSKKWTNLERQNAISRFMQDRTDYILCLKTDETSLPGLPQVVGYVSLKELGESKVYNLLLQKLGPPNHDNRISHLSDSDQGLAADIIRACYRRAIFTQMDFEIDLERMNSSLGEVLRAVQPLTAQISDPALQNNALEIVNALDAIERIVKRSGARWSNQWVNRRERHLFKEIDIQKMRIVDSLLEMRRAAQLPMQLPFTLESNVSWAHKQRKPAIDAR